MTILRAVIPTFWRIVSRMLVNIFPLAIPVAITVLMYKYSPAMFWLTIPTIVLIVLFAIFLQNIIVFTTAIDVQRDKKSNWFFYNEYQLTPKIAVFSLLVMTIIFLVLLIIGGILQLIATIIPTVVSTTLMASIVALFVLIGLYFATPFFFTPYLIVDKKQGVFQAIIVSRQLMTKQIRWMMLIGFACALAISGLYQLVTSIAEWKALLMGLPTWGGLLSLAGLIVLGIINWAVNMTVFCYLTQQYIRRSNAHS